MEAPKTRENVVRLGGESETARLARRVAALESILSDRERELLELKGPCSARGCRLHYAHSGPCDIQ